jgi:hypothetical protein
VVVSHGVVSGPGPGPDLVERVPPSPLLMVISSVITLVTVVVIVIEPVAPGPGTVITNVSLIVLVIVVVRVVVTVPPPPPGELDDPDTELVIDLDRVDDEDLEEVDDSKFGSFSFKQSAGSIPYPSVRQVEVHIDHPISK